MNTLYGKVSQIAPSLDRPFAERSALLRSCGRTYTLHGKYQSLGFNDSILQRGAPYGIQKDML